MADAAKTIKEQHSIALLKVLKNEQFTDVTFIIGKYRKKFRVNRVFFAIISPVFAERFNFNATPYVIELADIHAIGFVAVLKFAYANNPNLSTENVLFVKDICIKYKINSLSAMCDEYILSHINAQIFFKWMDDSIRMKLAKVTSLCLHSLHQISQNPEFEEKLSSDSFLDMGKSALILLLQSDYLHLSEELIWESSLKWIARKIDRHGMKRKVFAHEQHQESFEEMALLKDICPYIRFGLMQPQYFTKNVKPTNCLSLIELAQILSFMHGDKECGKFRTKRRKYKYKTDE